MCSQACANRPRSAKLGAITEEVELLIEQINDPTDQASQHLESASWSTLGRSTPGSSARTSIGRTRRQGQPNRCRPGSVEACAVDGSRVWTAEPEARGGLKYRLSVYHIFTHRSHQRIDIGGKCMADSVGGTLSSYGTPCAQCGDILIAPIWSEH